MPSLRMYIATMVTVAELENPEMASLAPIPVHGLRITNETSTAMAVMSLGMRSVTNSTSATPMMPNTSSIPVDIGGSAIATWFVSGG